MCQLFRQLEREKKNLEVKELSSSCRYHKRKGERFGEDNIFNGYRCLELFHTLYPKALALMYDAKLSEEELFVKCPSCENKVSTHLYRMPVKSFIRHLLNNIKQLLHPVWPTDVVNWEVYVEIISARGNCPARFKRKDRLLIHHIHSICPQALYSLFPAILLSKENDVCQCPSSVNRVVFGESKV